MIGKLTGTVDEVGDGHAVVDVGGVGYLVHCPATTLSDLVPGQGAILLIETFVREDMIRLFGFASTSEREWFRLLQSVQGVGTKVALAILGVLPPQALAHAIDSEDKAAIAKAPGVGPKLALRIAAELRGKVPEGLMASGVAPGLPPGTSDNAVDAASALVNLGYPRSSAMAAAVQAGSAGAVTVGEIVRAGLRILSRSV